MCEITGIDMTISGNGFLGLLGLIFVTLKLTGMIDWSWWIVLSPFALNLLLVAFQIWLAVFILRKRNRSGK